MTRTPSARGPRARAAAIAALMAGLSGAIVPTARAASVAPPLCRAGPDPFEIRLVPTAHANGAEGAVHLVFSESPFGIAVTGDGHHQYDARISTGGLQGRTGALVVWAATPELDRVRKLGVLDDAGTLDAARIAFNKFLVFVTEEPHAEVERWTGRILLRGISPSGRMHTMAGHGPFQGESCGGMFGPRW